MEILKIYLEEQLLRKYCVENHLTLLKIQNMMDINVDLLQFFNKKPALHTDKSDSGGAVKNEIMPNQQLAEELHKSISRKLEKRRVHLSFIDNISGIDLADMQLISKFSKGFRFSLCVIDILANMRG